MLDHAAPMIARLRPARQQPASRAALFGLALMLAGAQLLLQAHSISHDLLPSSHPVCEQCVMAKHSAPPPTVVGTPAASAASMQLADVVARTHSSRAPLVERSRGPPAVVAVA